MANYPVSDYPKLYQPDAARLALARRRQTAVFRGERPDAWPMLAGGPLTPAQEQLPNPNFKEAFDDADLMLSAQLRGACSAASGNGDSVPSMRVNFGTGIMLSCVGLEQEVFADKMPWLKEHLTKAQIAKLTPDDITIRGSFARGLDIMRRFKAVMGEQPAVYCMDTQGPFDLAHLMLGDAIFYQIHDDPPFVHHLMNLCLQMGIKTHTWMKEVSGEPLTQHYHGNSLYAENMGIRICEDTTAVVGPETISEFAMPYTRKLAQHFGGAWVHYCGRNDHLTQAILEIPEVRAINFGHIPGHEHDHPFEQDMARICAAHKVYFGGWPRRRGESGLAYLKRLHEWAVRGCLICDGAGAALGGENGLASLPAALEYWYSL